MNNDAICPACNADNVTDYPVCPTRATLLHFPGRTDCKCKECAELKEDICPRSSAR